MKVKELETLTIIRFLAAFWVFCFHFRLHIAWVKLIPEPYINLLVVGAVGMSLFFILSGFILTYNYVDLKLEGYWGYLLRRFARIYPTYFVSVLLTLPLVPIKADVIQSAFIMVIDALLLQAWFPVLFDNGHHSGTWSLSTEAFFYLLFPIVLLGLLRCSWRNRLFIGLATYLGASFVGLSILVFPTTQFAFVYTLPVFRLFEFTLGMLAGLAFKDKLAESFFQRWSWPLLILSVAAFVAYLTTYGADTLSFVGHNPVVMPFLTAIIFLSAYCPIRSRVLQFLGASSYSFYLYQFIPLIWTKQHLAEIRAIPFFNDVGVLFLAVFLVTQLFASIGYLLIERPCRRLLVRWLTPYRQTTLVA